MVTATTTRFFHANGQVSVRRELDDLLESGTSLLRIAVCFFTNAGFILLRRHGGNLNREGSYCVVSVDWPTDLIAVRRLHEIAPGHVFIHLGGATPNERIVGRALMHSKVLLATGHEGHRLWVGSHNLTGQGILGGNIEAGILTVTPEADPMIADVATHLSLCRDTAEVFDPDQMERYRNIQRGAVALPPWIRKEQLLVIHAEANVLPTGLPFTVHLQVVPTEFDGYFDTDQEVRLYLHPVGGLNRGVPASFAGVSLWSGSVTGIVRTELHPHNSGLHGSFSTADFQLELPDIFRAPTFSITGTSGLQPTSQVVLRMTGQGKPGQEIYSLDKVPVINAYDADPEGKALHVIDDDMRSVFTPESLRGDQIVYRAVRGVKQSIKVEGYEETMRTSQEVGDDLLTERRSKDTIVYEVRTPKRPVDAFIFVSKHVIDLGRQ